MLSRALALLTFLVILTPSLSSPLPLEEKSVTRDLDYYLPKNVIPEAYRLHIMPVYPDSGILGSETFSGDVVIDAKVDVATNKITLHKGQPTIEYVNVICVVDKTDAVQEDEEDILPPLTSVCDDGNSLLELSGTEEDKDTEKFTIILKDDIPSGREIRIALRYFAVYPEGGLTGFYVSTYEYEGEEVALLTSKFEPTHARKAFPCFDEPAFKATFKLFISLGKDMNAISNTRESWRNTTTNIVGFETTPVMSTYLLAFIVFEEESFVKTDVQMRPGSDIQFSTWGRKNMIENVKGGLLSQVEGPAALEFLEDYTGINYTETMNKMDMAAIPDFQSGAMENWGLVTYRENAILFNQQTGTTANHKRVVDVIDHELTHMWFGNLVTTNWWSSIWLNEGFARYIQYLVAHHRYPKWHMLERFVVDEQMSVMGVDASLSAAPITDNTVVSPEEIGNHFSTISYSKGGAILRQLENVMGKENFKGAIQKYLRANALKTATPEKLLENLVEFNQQDISHLTDAEFRTAFNIWTEKSGYPVITVSRNDQSFTISQKRFLLNPQEENDLYPVYLTWTTSKDEETVSAPKTPQDWLKSTEVTRTIVIDGIDHNDLVLFNAYQGGYYRVNYDDATWNLIGQFLEDAANLDRVSAIDRAALVDNAMALARAGTISYEKALRLLRFLRHETAFEPWAAARSALAHLQRMLGNEQPFKDFVAYIVEIAYNETYHDERMATHIDIQHHINVVTVACSSGYERCLEEARERLEDYLLQENNDRESFHPDIESVVFCYGLKDASSETWEKLWEEYEDSDALRRTRLINALGCIKNRDTLKRFLLMSLDENDQEKVYVEDAGNVFASVSANPDGGSQVALDFLSFLGYAKLEARYNAVKNDMSILIAGLASILKTEKEKNQLKTCLQNHASKHESALKTSENNINWMEANHADVLRILREMNTISQSSASINFVFPLFVILSTILMHEMRMIL